jgi:hypothetical protein
MSIETSSSDLPTTMAESVARDGGRVRPALLKAYRETFYTVGDVEVRIGRRSQAMDRLLLVRGVRQATFITAYNPYSRKMPPGWNQRMQGRLAASVRRRPILSAQGTGRRWSEAHLLVLGDVRLARLKARQFRQNAIVIVRLGQPVRLLVTAQDL